MYNYTTGYNKLLKNRKYKASVIKCTTLSVLYTTIPYTIYHIPYSIPYKQYISVDYIPRAGSSHVSRIFKWVKSEGNGEKWVEIALWAMGQRAWRDTVK